MTLPRVCLRWRFQHIPQRESTDLNKSVNVLVSRALLSFVLGPLSLRNLDPGTRNYEKETI